MVGRRSVRTAVVGAVGLVLVVSGMTATDGFGRLHRPRSAAATAPDAVPSTDAAAAAAAAEPTTSGQFAATTSPLRPTVDTVTFGSASSEKAHSLAAGWAPVVATTGATPSTPAASAAAPATTGLLGQTARALQPRTPTPDWYGGQVTFRMAVDPVRQTYFTVKVDGSAATSTWVLLLVDGREVGARNDYQMHGAGTLLQSAGAPMLPGRFVYRTVRIPWQATRGRSTVTVTLRSMGELNAYVSGGYAAKQQFMKSPSPKLYRAYTHVTAALDTSGETQPAAPTAVTAPGRDAAAYVAGWRTAVDARVAEVLAADPSTPQAPSKIAFLAQASTRTWSSAHGDARVLTWSAAAVDTLVRRWAADPSGFAAPGSGCQQWGLSFGDVGEAVTLLRAGTTSAAWSDLMTQTAGWGGSVGTTTRRAAWAAAIRSTVDAARYNRAGIDSQAILKDGCLWSANRGLRDVDPAKALTPAQAARYVHEAVGLAVWSGNDVKSAAATPVAGTPPFGTAFRMVTAAGTGRGPCLTGGDYGEYGSQVYALGDRMGDAAVKAKGLAMLRARAALRDPDVDAKKQRVVWVEEPVGCRNTHEVGWHPGYLGRGGWQDLLVGAQPVASIGKDLLGYLQQMAADNRLLPSLDGGYPSPGTAPMGAPYVPDLLTTVLARAKTGVRLPMTTAGDLVWADPDNAAVAAKHGGQRFYAVLNWRNADAVDGLAKVHVTTGRTAYVAEVSVDEARYTPSGRFVARDGKVAGHPDLQPPDAPVSAEAGTTWPVAVPPNGVTNRDGGHARGYTLRYGHWLVGMNPHRTASYTMSAPAGVTSAVDVRTGKKVALPLTLAPRRTVVLWVAAAVPTRLAPSAPQSVRAVAGQGAVTVGWDAAPGAVRYRVYRAAPGKAAVRVATGVAGRRWTDRKATPGVRYRYLVRGVSADGSLGPSSTVAAATAVRSTLPIAWALRRIGSGGTGSASSTGGTVTVTGAGGDVAGLADTVSFAHTALVGNGTLVARVASVTGSTGYAGWARAGVMVRTGLSAGSPQASLLLSSGQGAVWGVRNGQGAWGTNTTTAGRTAPGWVRITRKGNSVTGSVSSDGTSWTTVGTTTLALPTTVYVGLATVSAGSAATTARFDHLTLGP